MFKRAPKVKKVAVARVARNPFAASDCNCTMCVGSRNGFAQPSICTGTSTDPRAAEKRMVEKRFTMSQARAAFTNYYENIKEHLDFSTMRERGGGEYIMSVKPFEEVTGFVKLGSGAYSIVYAMSETKVLKVVRGTDEGYAKFVRACQENKGNPYLPKILYEGKWAGKQVYVLERLTDEHPDKDKTWQAKTNFSSALNYSTNNPYLTFADENLRTVARILQDGNMTGDLHHGNMMFRGTTPVVTDPCAY